MHIYLVACSLRSMMPARPGAPEAMGSTLYRPASAGQMALHWRFSMSTAGTHDSTLPHIRRCAGMTSYLPQSISRAEALAPTLLDG